MSTYTDEVWIGEAATPVPHDEHADAVEPTVVAETPVAAASRVLEGATITADQLVSDARAEADELRVASHEETDRVLVELTQLREEKVADPGPRAHGCVGQAGRPEDGPRGRGRDASPAGGRLPGPDARAAPRTWPRSATPRSLRSVKSADRDRLTPGCGWAGS